MFNELVPGTDSYHEAVAVVVTRKHTDLDVHVDPENDWRPGHNTMHALSFTGNDAKVLRVEQTIEDLFIFRQHPTLYRRLLLH